MATAIGDFAPMPDELIAQRALLREALITLNHARVFVSTREKMHPVGVSLYDDLVDQIEKSIGF